MWSKQDVTFLGLILAYFHAVHFKAEVYSVVHLFIMNSNSPLLVMQSHKTELVIKHTIPIKIN